MKPRKSATRTGSRELGAVNADGSASTPVTTEGGLLPAVSPDGRRIVFTSGRNGDDEVYVIDAAGSPAIQHGLGLTATAARSNRSRPRPLRLTVLSIRSDK